MAYVEQNSSSEEDDFFSGNYSGRHQAILVWAGI